MTLRDPAPDAVTFGTLLLKAAEVHPNKPAFVSGLRSATYSQVAVKAKAVAGALLGEGLRQGDSIGLLMDSSMEYLELVAGASLIGVIAVLINTASTRQAVAELLAERGIDLVFASRRASSDHAAKLRQAGAQGRRRVAADGGCAYVVVGEAKAGERPYDAFVAAAIVPTNELNGMTRALGQDAPFADVFTSGVTHSPRLCRTTHANILCKAAAFAEALDLTAGSRIWVPVPMYQIGFISVLFYAIYSGATLLFSEEFSTAGAMELLARERVTHAYPIYTQYWLPLIYHPRFQPSLLPNLSHICLLGPINVLRRAQRMLPQGVIMNMYGSAEEAGACCLPRADEPPALRLSAGGWPLPGYEIRVVEPLTGAICAPGQTGEIQLRGAGVAQSVPDRSDADGWLRKEDLGALNADGRLRYLGRVSELLNIAGENLSAEVIETAICDFSAIAFAQVIQRQDEAAGPALQAFVELRPGAVFEVDKFLAFCVDKLGPARTPTYVTIVEEWPISASKIRKHALAALDPGPRLVLPAAADDRVRDDG